MQPALLQLWYCFGVLYRVESLRIDEDYDRADLVEVARDTRTTDRERQIIADRLEHYPSREVRLAEFDAPRAFVADAKWFELAPKWPDRGYWGGTVDEWLASRRKAA